MPKRSSKKGSRGKKKPSRPSDINRLATQLVSEATEEATHKNPAAVALGRLGGLKGGKARADALSSSRRKDIARRAAKARWSMKSS
jgi:hypothetical protein